MTGWKSWRAEAALAVAFFVTGSLALCFTRFHHGVAFIWPGSALLAWRLTALPLARWWRPMVSCAIASTLASGWFGFGWLAAPGLDIANVAEATSAAWLIRRLIRYDTEIDSPAGIATLLFSLAVIAPLIGAAMALFTMLFTFQHPDPDFPREWYISHGLGLLLFVPTLHQLRESWLARVEEAGSFRRDAPRVLFHVALAAAVALASFGQAQAPIAFIPVIVLVACAVWTSAGQIAVMFLALVLISMICTATGRGPIALLTDDPGTRMHMLSFYLATTLLAIIPIVKTVARQQRLLERLTESEERYRMLADHSTDIIMSTDAEGIIRFISPSVQTIGLYNPDQLIGQRADRVVAPIHVERVRDAHRRALAAPGEVIKFEFLGLPREGEPRWLECNQRAVVGAGPTFMVSMIRDISARKVVEDRLNQAAMTDQLTGVANRRRFELAIEEHAQSGRDGCVAMIDLDHFKTINDRYGHAGGDAVLRQFARIARENLRNADLLARIGGEEFALVLPGASLDDAEAICARVCQGFSRSITRFEGAEIAATASIGLARLARDPRRALREADGALYAAKSAGRDRLAIAA